MSHNLFLEYSELITDYIVEQTGGDREQIAKFVQDRIKEKYQPISAVIVHTTSPGNLREETVDFLTFLNKIGKEIITPSGSFYMHTEKRGSVISQMLVDKLAERKAIKKKQLQAEADGNKELAQRCHYQQATIKINANSMPGGFGSAYNIFYDKGGYNAITSTARYMIARAYTIAEQLLGGNFSWFSEEELINHIILLKKACPPKEQIEQTIKKYRLKTPTVKELLDFYTETLRQYVPQCCMVRVDHLLSKQPQHVISFLFYYCNLRHIMWYNDEVFRGYFKWVMSLDGIVKDPNVDPKDAWKIDDTVMAVTTVAHAETFNNRSLKTIIDEDPEMAKYLIAIAKAVEVKLHTLDQLFDTFVNNETEIPEIQNKPMTWRNTVPISDTDSVIFTAKHWDTWYRGAKTDVVKESYQITSLVIYWLTHAVKYALKRFSVRHGVTGDLVYKLAMKNEFLYPCLLLFDTKKTYAGIQLVQEGVIFPKPKPDIKGQKIRGSILCKESLDFAQDLIVNDVLTPVMDSKISVMALIQKVVAFENKIRASICAGETQFMKITSLKYKKDYKKPESTSVYFAYMFWQAVFAKKYGEMQPPLKTIFFGTINPLQSYWNMLHEKYPKIYEDMLTFVNQYKKFPGTIIINPQLEKIPTELLPVIDIREIIYDNIKPTYYTLNRLGISCGFEKQKVLLSDIYHS